MLLAPSKHALDHFAFALREAVVTGPPWLYQVE
jgi:hypothetical protein